MGVTAKGDFQLEFALSSPNKGFLRLLATTYAMPCNEELFQRTMGRYGLEGETIPANGPFTVYTWKEKQIRLRKNEAYRGAETVKPEEVRMNIPVKAEEGEEPFNSAKRLEEGMIDAALVDSAGDFLQKGYNSEAIENSVWGLYFNWKNPILANADIRRSIALCFDRDSYRDSLRENQKAAYAILPHDIRLDGRSFREVAGEDLSLIHI